MGGEKGGEGEVRKERQGAGWKEERRGGRREMNEVLLKKARRGEWCRMECGG